MSYLYYKVKIITAMNQNLSQNVKIIQRGVHKYMSRYDLNLKKNSEIVPA